MDPLQNGFGKEYEFSAPTIILFDSYDKRVHDNARAIEEYHYLEYGEFWFDNHSIQTAARKIEENVVKIDENSGAKVRSAPYEVIAGRYEDHLRLRMLSPSYEKEVIVALPSGSKAACIAVTGEHCEIGKITVEKTGVSVGPDELPRITDVISYIDRMESDIENIQVDRTRSASTDGIELKDRLTLLFHTMSLPSANLVWHCPYFIIFSSDDGKVGGTHYKEYASIKLYGENDGSSEVSENHIEVVKTDEFPGWDVWKEINKKGMECKATFKKKDNRIVLKTANLGIEMENVTTINGSPDKIYVALTGDQVALTDIRVKY